MLGQSPGQQVSPAGQSFLQTAVSQVLPPAVSTNSMVAPSTGIHPQQSMNDLQGQDKLFHLHVNNVEGPQ